MNNLQLDVDFLINNPEVRASTQQVRNDLNSVGDAAERVQNNVNRNIRNTVATANATAAASRTQFNGLQNSINQISRELPAFTYSAQTGFMAISNNLPILFDQIGRLRAENEALVASGQKGVPVWKQIIGSLFSWGTVMSVGITLMTVYGKELGNWIKSLFSSRDALEAVKKSQENLTDIRIKAGLSLATSTAQLEAYIAVAKNEKLNLDQRQEAVRNIIKLDKERLGGITLETLKTGEATAAINLYIDALKRQSIEKAISSKREDLIKQRYDNKKGYDEVNKQVGDLRNSVANQKFKNKNSDEETATEAAYRKAKAKREKEIQKDKDLLKQIADVDAYAKKQYEASVKPEPTNSKKNRTYFQNIIDTAQAGLDSLDKGAADFAARSKAYIKTINDAKKELAAFDPNNDQKVASQGLKDEISFDSAIAGRKDLLEKLKQLDENYAGMSFDKDDEEKAALKKKFDEFRTLIEQENRRIIAYNKKNKKDLALIDGGMVAPIEQRANADLSYRQETQKLKVSLDEQKKLYADYESQKTSIGEEKAKERFTGQINTEKTYLEYLEGLRAKLLDKDPTMMDGGEKERLKQYDAMIKEEEKAENQKHSELLKSLMSYEQTRSVLVQNYNANRAKLEREGNTEAVTVLDTIHKEALGNLDDQNNQKLAAFKALYNGIDRLSDKAAEKVIANGKTMLKGLVDSGKISKEQAKDIADKLTDTGKALQSRLPDRLKSIGSELSNIADQVGGIDSGFGKWISSLGGVVGNIGQLKEQMASFEEASGKNDVLGQISGGIGMFGTIMSIGKTLGDLFGKAGRAQAEQAKYSSDLQLKQNEAVTKALDRQLALINQVYGTEKLVKYKEALSAIEIATGDVSKKLSGMYKLTGNKEIDRLIELFNSGELEEKGFDRAQFIGLQKKGVFQGFSTDIDELQKLLDSGSLGETAAKYAQSLIDLKEKANEAANAVKEALTGSSFESMADSIINLFADADTAAEDWGKNFQEIIKKAILNGFKTKGLATQLQGFYDQLAEMSQSGNQLSKDEIAALKAQYDKIIADGKKAFEDLQKVTGVDFNDPGSSSITGQIKRELTEKTGTEFVGLQRSTYDILKQILGISRDSTTAMRDSLMVQYAIQKNTFDTVEELKKINLMVYEINKNNKANSSSYDRGFGG